MTKALNITPDTSLIQKTAALNHRLAGLHDPMETSGSQGNMWRGMIAAKGRVSLHILMVNRWIMIACQLGVTMLGMSMQDFEFSYWAVLGIILIGIFLNLVCLARGNAQPWLSARTAALSLTFDNIQLTALLYLTGGLNNPFSVLILASVAVSAKILPRIHVLGVTGLAICCLTYISQFYVPLPWIGGEEFGLPSIYMAGVWLALVISCVVIASYSFGIAEEARRTDEAFSATQLALAREQRTASLGALAAAAAHNLGSPLATIAIIAKEMSREIPPDSPLAEDVELLLSQSDRCREILAELSEKPERDLEDPLSRAGLVEIVEIAAEPYLHLPKKFSIKLSDNSIGAEPIGWRGPEILHGLGNLLHNALEMATSEVKVTAEWDDNWVSLHIADDGSGFSPSVLPRLGEPYLSTRSGKGDHLGLGIFIAQTLLNYSGAQLRFFNAPTLRDDEHREGIDHNGARVIIAWPRQRFEESALDVKDCD